MSLDALFSFGLGFLDWQIPVSNTYLLLFWYSGWNLGTHACSAATLPLIYVSNQKNIFNSLLLYQHFPPIHKHVKVEFRGHEELHNTHNW